MRLALVLIVAVLLCGCAAQDCSDYYGEAEFERGVLLAYGYGVTYGLDACLPCPPCPPCLGLGTDFNEREIPWRFRDAFREAARETRAELVGESEGVND